MKTLELFAGTKSFSKVAEKLGHVTFTTDVDPRFDCDYTGDILNFDTKEIYFGKPDIIWASPPCTAFSVASIGSSWCGSYCPKRVMSALGMAYVLKTLEIIKKLQPKFWFIENPRGVLRKMAFMDGLKRNTITYCQYGDTRIYGIIDNMKHKKCPKCGNTKKVECFYKNITRKEGFASWCKSCDNENHTKFVENNKEQIRKYDRKYYNENVEIKREQSKNSYKKNKIKISKKAKDYRLDNIEMFREKDRIYHKNNKEKSNEQSREYYAENSDMFKNKARERKLFKKEISDGTVTLKFEKEQFELQNGKCAYCNCVLKNKHLDHILPISRGGLHTKNNVHWVCPECNLSKKDKTEEEWIMKERMKPTDIWTNCGLWIPKPMCKNGEPCHVSAPRGSKTGTQGLKGAMERSVIPPELFEEIFKSIREAIL